METNQYEKGRRSRGSYLLAMICIVIGILFLGRNIGFISSDVFHFIVSWPMVVVVWGIYTLFHRHFTTGTILILIGLYFLFPALEWISNDWLRTYWPLGLVALGLLLIVKTRKTSFLKSRHRRGHFDSQRNRAFIVGENEEGYVNSDISFSSVKHIVLDPVFKGANLDVSFGGINLDLRRTTLAKPETWITVNSSFGGIELYIPDTWTVRIDIDSFLGGCTDHRYPSNQPDPEHILVIRGDLTFSGLEIKS